MSAPDEPLHDEALHQFVHDLQNCLHVAGLGLEILKGARDDDGRFAEVSDWVGIEHRKGIALLAAYLHAADVPPSGVRRGLLRGAETADGPSPP